MATEQKLDIVIDLQTKNAGALARLEKQLGSTGKASQKSSKEMDNLGETMFAAQVAAQALFQGLGMVTNGMKQLVTTTIEYSKMAAKQRDLQKGFARTFGEDTVGNINKLREASGGAISDLNLMQAANRSSLLGVTSDTEKLSQLMITARLRGREMGLDTTQAFDDIVTGIGRGSPLILDNLGIKIPDALKETMQSMDEATKMETLLNFAIEDGQKLLEDYGGTLELTASEKFGALEAGIDNTKVNLGELGLDAIEASGIMDILGGAVEGVNDFIDDFNQGLEDNKPLIDAISNTVNTEMVPALNDLSEQLGMSGDAGEDLAEGFLILVLGAAEFTTKLAGMLKFVSMIAGKLNDLSISIANVSRSFLGLDSIQSGPTLGNLQNKLSNKQNVVNALQVKNRASNSGGAVQNFAKGGEVKPVYASNGFFQPKGTDTVPAMLTPGEIVLPKGVSDSIRSILTAGGGAGGGVSFTPQMPGVMVEDIEAYFNTWSQKVAGLSDEQIRTEKELQAARIDALDIEDERRIESLKQRAAQEVMEFEGTEEQKAEFRRNIAETTEREITDIVERENEKRALDYQRQMEKAQQELERRQQEAKRIEEAADLQLSRLRIEAIEDETERRIAGLNFEAERDIKSFEGTMKQKREFEKLTKELLTRELAEIEQRNNPAAQQQVSIDLNRAINMPINIGTINENVDANGVIKQIVRSLQHLDLGIA